MEILTMPETAFGNRLKALRAAAGLTQAALAKKAGISTDGVRAIEQGKREPAFSTAVLLADALGVSVEQFRTKRKKR